LRSSDEREGLTEIGLRHGTDKVHRHAYTDYYERLLGHLRDEPITLLEFGIGGYRDPMAGGSSLRMWRDYFPRATVIGVDIFDKTALAEDRITILQGDQSDTLFLEKLGRELGPFDVVIDDGSHIPKHVLTTFHAIFPFVVDGGYYIVEDTQTSYWPAAGGSLLPRSNRSTMGFFKRRVDGLNYSEFRFPGYRPTDLDRTIVEISFRHNALAVRKGENVEEPGSPTHPIAHWPWFRRSVASTVRRAVGRLRHRLARASAR